VREAALIYLSRDFLLNIDMIEGIRRSTADILYAGDNGVLVRYHGRGLLAVSADTAEDAVNIIADAGGVKDDIIVHQGEFADAIAERFGLRELMERFYNCIFTKPVAEPVGDIRPLGMEYAEFVAAHYDHSDLDYIKGRIAAGNLFGIFVDDKLAGFVGEHEEGSMGMLEVLPEYRQRGLGTQLDRFNILRERAMGHVPYGQIIASNALSIKMHGDMGAVIDNKLCAWLGRE